MVEADSNSSSLELSLVAPVDGVVVPLEQLPDPVFAGKMLGDGLSIDPTSTRVLAPCSGVIAQFHRAHHALTIRSPSGVSVLVHVGLDTVNLKGKGFEPKVSEGDEVQQGQHLLEFDLETICEGALSAQVEVVVTEGGGELTNLLREGEVVAGENEIFRVVTSSASRSSRGSGPVSAEEGEELSTRAVIRNPNGMHARPAAQLTQIAKRFRSEIRLSHGKLTVSATSVTEIMSLDLERDSEVRIRAQGLDAAQAIAALSEAISAGLGEDPNLASAPQEAARLESSEEGVLGGVPASPGIVVGTAVLSSFELPVFSERSADAGAARLSLKKGLANIQAELRAEEVAFREAGEKEKAQIFSAHAELLDDKSLVSEAEKGIARGLSGPQAFREVMEARIEMLGTLKSALLRQRASDMKDVMRRVLYATLGQDAPRLKLSKESILVCDDLTPSTAASLDNNSIGGLVTELGGSTSHAAIIARSMGVPYIAGLGSDIGQLTEGMRLIVNGSTGSLSLDPSDELLDEVQREIERLKKEEAQQKSHAHKKVQTEDGFSIEVAANIGNLKDAEQSVESGADGVGLLRSEFLFLNRRDAPSEKEQRTEYEAIAKCLGKDRSLVLRTLDVGGDKPLSYMPLEEEENPFLGVRGLRISLKFPELFRSQIRAALAAARHTKLNIMFPMVSGPEEFSLARQMVREEAIKLGLDGQIAIGVMVEVPSAALNAGWLAKDADFFSIGTNDLTQYTLAMDRGHSELSKKADAFDPAVLRLIQMTVQAAHAEGKWVGVCGGLAAEPLATPLLIGLDLDELSVPAPVIPALKSKITGLNHRACQAVAEGALALPTASKVRALLQDFLGD